LCSNLGRCVTGEKRQIFYDSAKELEYGRLFFFWRGGGGGGGTAVKRRSSREIRDNSLRDKDKLTTEMFGNIAPFESKLCWWECRFILRSNLTSSHTKRGFSDPVKEYCKNISLLQALVGRFRNLSVWCRNLWCLNLMFV